MLALHTPHRLNMNTVSKGRAMPIGPALRDSTKVQCWHVQALPRARHPLPCAAGQERTPYAHLR